MNQSNYQLQTLGRSLDLLIWLERQPEPKTMTMIAEALNVAPPAAFRMLKTLEAKGFVVQSEGGKRYALPPVRDRLAGARDCLKLIRLLLFQPPMTEEAIALEAGLSPEQAAPLLELMQGFQLAGRSEDGSWQLSPGLAENPAMPPQFDLRAHLRPVMEAVWKCTDETVALFVTSGHMQVVIDVLQTTQPLRYALDLGAMYPLYAGAAGKAALAWQKAERIEAILADPATRLAGVDADRLLRDLEATRNRGYALSSGERVPGAAAAGVAIFDGEGRMRGVLNISGPAHRADAAVINGWGEIMIAEMERAGIAYRPLRRAEPDTAIDR